MVLIQQLFAHLRLKERLRRCFRHLTKTPIFGWPSIVLLLIVHALLGYRDLRQMALRLTPVSLAEIMGTLAGRSIRKAYGSSADVSPHCGPASTT